MKNIFLVLVILAAVFGIASASDMSYQASLTTAPTTVYAGACWISGIWVNNYSTNSVTITVLDNTTTKLDVTVPASTPTAYVAPVFIPLKAKMDRIRVTSSLKIKSNITTGEPARAQVLLQYDKQ